MRPYTLIAELTYRCPLACVYCSNPIDFRRYRDELDTGTWRRTLLEAEALGVVQVCFTGGEPLVRTDLEVLVETASAVDLYSNLITSGVGLARERLKSLRDAGLRSVQLSIQDVDSQTADRIAGQRSHESKLEAAQAVKDVGLPLTINIVLHRENIERAERMLALAEALGADRIELANAQYLGWALVNRAWLLPTAGQLERARTVAAEARERMRGRMEVVFVTPDYYSEVPPPCMDGWGRRFIVISPNGLVLPCHAAHTIPDLKFENVRDCALGEVWERSTAINLFRGEAWMPPACRSCERRTIDFAGCRCQAYYLTGRADAMDPVCSRSPEHVLVERARQDDGATKLRYRSPRLGQR
jgi:pyrroloquinoline quinone biosynthesis protein E